MPNLKSIKYQLILGIVLGVVISIVIIFLYIFFSHYYKARYQEKLIESDTYQAVFLNNNQIYFGRLMNIGSQYPILTDVYYVKLDSIEATSGKLVKLGETEPHGPKDEMILNREHILFWENLRSNSQIVQKIKSLELERK